MTPTTRPYPDGKGLPPLAAEQAAAGATVHLRVSHHGLYPSTACGRGLGQLWSGVPAEVSCPACKEAHRARYAAAATVVEVPGSSGPGGRMRP
jgi:hypothetical protein